MSSATNLIFDPAQVIFISIPKIQKFLILGRATSAKIKIDWHRPAHTTLAEGPLTQPAEALEIPPTLLSL